MFNINGKEIRMKLRILGCPDKDRFRPYVRRAVKFYAKELFSEKMLENLKIKIKFHTNLDNSACASVEDYNDSGKPRSFLIEIHSYSSGSDILKAIAHEMIHVKQFACGDLNECLTRWKGNRIEDGLDYWKHPWEIDAYGTEVGLFYHFSKKEKLWEVFDNVRDPDAPFLPEPIGWKVANSQSEA